MDPNEKDSVIVIDDNPWDSLEEVEVSLAPPIDLSCLSFASEPKSASRVKVNNDKFETFSCDTLKTLLHTAPNILNASRVNANNDIFKTSSHDILRNLLRSAPSIPYDGVEIIEEPVEVIDIASDDDVINISSDEESPKKTSRSQKQPETPVKAKTTVKDEVVVSKKNPETPVKTKTTVKDEVVVSKRQPPQTYEQTKAMVKDEVDSHINQTQAFLKTETTIKDEAEIPEISKNHFQALTVAGIKSEVDIPDVHSKHDKKSSTAEDSSNSSKSKCKHVKKSSTAENSSNSSKSKHVKKSSTAENSSNSSKSKHDKKSSTAENSSNSSKSKHDKKSSTAEDSSNSSKSKQDQKSSTEKKPASSTESKISGKKKSKLAKISEMSSKSKTVTLSKHTIKCTSKKRKIILKGLNSLDEINSEIKRIVRESRQNATRFPSTIKKKSQKKKFKTDEKRLYLCAHCLYQTNRRVDIKLHLVVRHNKLLFSRSNNDLFPRSSETEYFCRECPYRTLDLGRLNAHSAVHPKEKPAQEAPQLRLTTTLQNNISKPIVVLKKMKIHCCVLCSFKTVNISNFNEHVSNNHPPKLNIKSADPVYRCDYCLFETMKASYINRHLRKVHRLPAGYFPCNLCNAEFRTCSKLDEHCTTTHKKKKIEECEKQPRIVIRKSILRPKWECTFCKRVFLNPLNLETHLFHTHKCIGPVRCQVCGHSSRNVWDLQAHFSGHGNFVFCCTLCKFRDSNRNAVQAHISSEHTFVKIDSDRVETVKPFPCQFCDYEASTLEGLKSHLDKEHPSDDLFSCNFCPRLFKEKSTLLKHTRDKHQNHKSEKYKCDQCNFVSKRGNFGLRKHVQLKHRMDFRCENCEYSSNKESSLKMHCLKVHSVGPQRYVCPYCNFSCVTVLKLKSHIMYKHALSDLVKKSSNLKMKIENKIECPVKTCSSKGFPHRRAMYDHLREKHNIKWKFRCEHCEFGTNSLRTLSLHISSEHWEMGEDPPIKIFNCDLCRYNTKSIYRFVNHIDKLHQSKWNFSRKDHIFKCDACGFTASNTRTINLHIAKSHDSTYTGCHTPKPKRTFVYNCEDCTFKTDKLNSFERHAKSHLNLDNDTFSCPHCPNVFSCAQSLKSHLSIVHYINKSLLYVAKNYCSKMN